MHRILIADDDLATRSFFARVLSNEGYRVETVGDGHTAVERVAAAVPDLAACCKTHTVWQDDAR